MKKKLLYGLILTIVFGTIYMVISSVSTLKDKSEGSKNTLVLSSLINQLKDASNKSQRQNYLKPSLLIYFNSECDYCQHQLEQINDTPDILRQFQLILVSYQNASEVEEYLVKHHAIAQTNYTLYQLAPDQVLSTFGKTSVPQLYVYQDNLLKSSFKGLTKTESILKSIKL